MKNQEKGKTDSKTSTHSRPKNNAKTSDRPKTNVESDTGKRPEKDSNPLPPNPNKVDNHDDE